MKLDIEIIELPEQPALTIRESANLESIPERMGMIFSEIMAFMEMIGIAPAGAPFAYWHNMNPESVGKGIFDMECGFPVGVSVQGEGQIRAGRLPGGRVATAMHIGSYDTLAETYEAAGARIKELGYEAKQDMWEAYLTDPCRVPENQSG